MAGVSVAETLCLPLLLVFALQVSSVYAVCVVDVCCCYSDGYNASYKAKIDAFGSVALPQGTYYAGIRPKGDEVYDHCGCSDVTFIVTSMRLNDTTYLTEAADPGQRDNLTLDVYTKLNAMKSEMMAADTTLSETLISINTAYSNHSSEEVVMDVEFILKGRNEDYKTRVLNEMNDALPSSSLNPLETMEYLVVKCAGDPPPALKNGVRRWTNSKLALVQATYTCNNRYNLSTNNEEEVSTCSQTTAEWTSLPAGVECVPETDRCMKDPPKPPNNTISNWNNYTKSEGTEVEYRCMTGYSPKDNLKANTTCNGGEWSPVSDAFECIETGCLTDPHQIPYFAVMDWRNDRDEGATIVYSCEEGYKSSKEMNPIVVCKSREWVGYPEDWKCIDENEVLQPNAMEGSEDEDEMNLFYIVTIPSVVGLVVLILCCLCCTRTDSPLFNICSAKAPTKAGYTSA